MCTFNMDWDNGRASWQMYWSMVFWWLLSCLKFPSCQPCFPSHFASGISLTLVFLIICQKNLKAIKDTLSGDSVGQNSFFKSITAAGFEPVTAIPVLNVETTYCHCYQPTNKKLPCLQILVLWHWNWLKFANHHASLPLSMTCIMWGVQDVWLVFHLQITNQQQTLRCRPTRKLRRRFYPVHW